jgi:hypothetical protein
MLHLICILAIFESWYISAPNICNTYLYGKLNDKISIKQLKGYKAPDKEHKVLVMKTRLDTTQESSQKSQQ